MSQVAVFALKKKECCVRVEKKKNGYSREGVYMYMRMGIHLYMHMCICVIECIECIECTECIECIECIE